MAAEVNLRIFIQIIKIFADELNKHSPIYNTVCQKFHISLMELLKLVTSSYRKHG
jgi:hypothetical protein